MVRKVDEAMAVGGAPSDTYSSALGGRAAEVDREFSLIDVDGSGSLDRQEVIDACRTRGLPAASERIDAFFQRADIDGDGKISAAEYRSFARERVAELRTVYDRMDVDGDGRLTANEMRRAARSLGFKITAEQLRRAYIHADSNRDGTISFDEFVSFLVLLPDCNPAAIFEAFASFYMESASSEYAPPAEVVCDEDRAQLLSVLASKVYSGSIAGGVSRTLTAPIDRLKTLMQAAPPGQPSVPVSTGLRNIYAEGGFAAFFRGNSVNVLKIAPETSIKFVAFDQLKGSLAVDRDSVTLSERFVAGGCAGALAQVAIYPLEICKTRMALSAAGVHSGIWDCLGKIVRAEGVGALYRGLSTSLVGIVPYASCPTLCILNMPNTTPKHDETSTNSQVRGH